MPAPSKTGRPRQYPLRAILNAICYVPRTGCQWRAMAYALPHWKTSYHYFWRWRQRGWWEHLKHHPVRAGACRPGAQGPTQCGIIDSQSVKTTGVGGQREYDGCQKINRRKRHLLVDTQGLLLKVKFHSADAMERDSVELLLPPTPTEEQFLRLSHVWLNGAYKGKHWIEQQLGWAAQTYSTSPSRAGCVRP